MQKPSAEQTERHARGRRAEAIARSWLEHHGYTFIEANYRRRVGELDLVVRHPDNNTIVFVEVRYRGNTRYGGALASVDQRKQRKLIHTAKAWLQRHATSRTPARIDVIALGKFDDDMLTTQCWQGHRLQWIISAVEE